MLFRSHTRAPPGADTRLARVTEAPRPAQIGQRAVPSANGFIAWTADPWVAPTSASVGVPKYLYLNAAYIQAPVVTEKAWFHISVTASGVTGGANWITLRL